MLIDDEEVCLGGGYITSFQHPTISIKNKNIVKFFSDYFEYLRDNSKNVRSDDNINMELIDRHIDA